MRYEVVMADNDDVGNTGSTLVYSKEMIRTNKFYSLNEAKITKEMNRAGSFEFSIFENNPFSNLFEPFKKHIAVWKVNEFGQRRVFFVGRVLKRKKTFNNMSSIFCEGHLAYLNDGDVPPYFYKYSTITNQEYFKRIMDNYNSEVLVNRKILTGIFDAPSEDYLVDQPEWISTIQALNNLRDKYGGYLNVQYVDMDGYIGVPHLNIKGIGSMDDTLFDIEYGKNMLDFSYEEDASNLVTVVRPFGKKIQTKDDPEGRIDISGINSGYNYLINTINVEKYGRIVKDIIYDHIDNTASLMILGGRYLLNHSDIVPIITAKVLDIHHLYDMDIALKVKVISKIHSISKPMFCSKLIEYFDKPQSNEYTFTTDQSSYLKPKEEHY